MGSPETNPLQKQREACISNMQPTASGFPKQSIWNMKLFLAITGHQQEHRSLSSCNTVCPLEVTEVCVLSWSSANSLLLVHCLNFYLFLLSFLLPPSTQPEVTSNVTAMHLLLAATHPSPGSTRLWTGNPERQSCQRDSRFQVQLEAKKGLGDIEALKWILAQPCPKQISFHRRTQSKPGTVEPLTSRTRLGQRWSDSWLTSTQGFPLPP